jgi:hypothetical protein
MKIKSLRELILETPSPVPSDFSSFRQVVAGALKKTNVPLELVDVVEDVEYEGPEVKPLFTAWTNLDYELKNGEDWYDAAGYYIRDGVYDFVMAYSNLIDQHIDPQQVADKVVADLFN